MILRASVAAAAEVPLRAHSKHTNVNLHVVCANLRSLSTWHSGIVCSNKNNDDNDTEIDHKIVAPTRARVTGA